MSMMSKQGAAIARALIGISALMLTASTTASAMPGCLSRSSISPDGMLRMFGAPLDRAVSIKESDIALRDALDRVASVANVRLTYSADLLPRDRRVCLDLERVSAGIVLTELLRSTQLRPLAVDADNVVLAPARGPTVSEAAPVPAQMSTVSQLEQIVVTGTADGTTRRSSPFAMEVINGSQLVNTNARNLADALDGAVPGIWMWTQTPSSTIGRYGSVRGASSFGVTSPKIYVDGIEVANPLVVTQIDPERIDRVEIIRGPQGAALYGADAISGVVNIISRHDGARSGDKLATLSTRAGHSSSAYAGGTFVQDHSLGIRAGSGRRTIGIGATVGTVGDYIPGGGARSFLGDADVRLVGSRTVFTGIARYSAKESGALVNPLLATVNATGAPYGGLNQQYGPDQGGAGMGGQRPTSNSTMLTTPTDSSQSLRQYTVGTTTTFMQNARWMHTVVAGADGYQMNGVATQGMPIRSRPDSMTPLAHSESDRTTASFRSIARFGEDEGNQTTLTLGAEHAATRQQIELSGERRSGEFSLHGTSLAEATSVWSNTAGVLAQVNSSFRNEFFFTAGGRVERTSGFSSPARVSLLPMLGAVYVREKDGQTLKLRASYGKGIRPSTSALRSATWMGGQGSSLLSSAGSQVLLSSLRNLEPESQAGIEVGADVLFGPMLGLHITRFDQRATGLIQAVALPGTVRIGSSQPEQGVSYVLQNVGAISNRGWELQSTSMFGRWNVVAGASFVDSRVQRVAQRYGGELRVGDRMLEVPARTFSLQANYVSPRWSMSWTASRAQDWVNYDQLRLAEQRQSAGFDARQVTGPSLRNYWRAYDGATRLRGNVTYAFTRGFSLVMSGENLLNLQRGEPDNVTIVPGRTLTAGIRTRF
jgi:outer membrane receptor protein involved in Fe transport